MGTSPHGAQARQGPCWSTSAPAAVTTAALLRDRSRSLEELRSSLGPIVMNEAVWQGSDADAFRGDDLEAQAEEQDGASEVASGSILDTIMDGLRDIMSDWGKGLGGIIGSGLRLDRMLAGGAMSATGIGAVVGGPREDGLGSPRADRRHGRDGLGHRVRMGRKRLRLTLPASGPRPGNSSPVLLPRPGRP